MAVDATFFAAGARPAVAACASILEALGARPAADAASADIVLASSDVTPLGTFRRAPAQILCDITAYGASGPLAGVPHSDAFLQAVTGISDTTGEPDMPPTLCDFPVTEGIGALHAAAGVVAALHLRRQGRGGEALEIALYDCAVSTLTTFLPFHFEGKPVSRAGNRHVLASPWNLYKARDQWLLVCTGSDDQWRRLCKVLQRPDLGADDGFARSQQRVAKRDLVDAAVQAWLDGHDAAKAAELLAAEGIACGPVVPAAGLATEPNLRHRGFLGRPPFRLFTPVAGPAPAAGSPMPWPLDASATGLPYAGMRVLEIGQYTTAPLVSRQLGALGATVLKIEPPAGDPTRAWAPHQDGQSHFFSMSNTEKTSLVLDLKSSSDKARFAALAAQADVLVENLKPGSLDRLGLGSAALASLNPRLVYCAVSGFGAESAYPGRPAFDTVVQAMSGIMDRIRVRDVPQKTGISLADVLGGMFGLIATQNALLARESFPQALHVDMSMQDAAAWLARLNSDSKARIVAVEGGFAVEEGGQRVPVRTIGEVAEHPQTLAREIVVRALDGAGRTWRVFACPIRFASQGPLKVRRVIGRLGEASKQFAA